MRVFFIFDSSTILDAVHKSTANMDSYQFFYRDFDILKMKNRWGESFAAFLNGVMLWGGGGGHKYQSNLVMCCGDSCSDRCRVFLL